MEGFPSRQGESGTLMLRSRQKVVFRFIFVYRAGFETGPDYVAQGSLELSAALLPQHGINRACTHVILRKWMQGGQEFRAILNYIMSLGLACAT